MADEKIVVEYELEEGVVEASIELARNEPGIDVLQEADADVDWVELTADDVKEASKFTEFLERESRSSWNISAWCTRDAWNGFLKLINERPPLSKRVKWPVEDA